MIYLDYNATTSVRPEVREVLLLFLTDEWGNPSSTYAFGGASRQMVRFSIGSANAVDEIDVTVTAVRRATAALKS